MSKSLLIGLVAACCSAHCAWSQQPPTLLPPTTILVPTAPWVPDNGPRTAAEVQSLFQNGVELGTWIAALVSNLKSPSEVNAAIEGSLQDIAKEIAWTGEGALVRVRVIEKDSVSSDPGSLAMVDILGNRAFLVATGLTPEDALFDAWAGEPQLELAPPTGWHLHPFGTNYSWVTLDASGRPHATVLPRGLATDLDQRLKADFGSIALRHYARQIDATDLWAAVARKAKERLTDFTSKETVDSVAASIKHSHERVTEANAKLVDALDRERRARAAQNTIRLMQGLLTVAQLVQEVRSTTGEAPASLTNASNAAEVQQAAETISTKASEQVKSDLSTFERAVQLLKQDLAGLAELAGRAGASTRVYRKLDVDAEKIKVLSTDAKGPPLWIYNYR
jgi:hypothetical protein